ncbi:MAG: T9SS type A sorting domain-containing protein [candidate division WOR-3 bacterium]
MKRLIVLSFFFGLVFAGINPGYLPKGTEIIRTANARHYANGDGTIRAVIEAEPSFLSEADTLLPNFSGFSELAYLWGSLYQAIKWTTPVRNAFFCGYWGEYYPDAYELERGWVEWDISSIPDGAIINNVICRTYRTEITGSYPNVNLYQMTNRPSGSADALTLYNDAGSGPLYGGYTPTVSGWNTATLSTQARTDLQNHLSDNWFAIGYSGTGPTSGVLTWEIGFAHHTYSPYSPQLIVDYSLPYDVGVTKIVAPAGTIDSGTVFTPACSVFNYGTNTVSYNVRMKIGNFYNQTANVSSHSPNQLVYVTFPQTNANWQRGSYPVSCSTELSTDMNWTNDKKTGSFSVRVRDVGVLSLVLPPEIDSGTSLTPACTVYNFGTTSEGPYLVRLKIGDFYNQVGIVNSHNPQEKLYLTFPSISNLPRGNHPVSCSTEFTYDLNPTNNRLTGSLMVYVSDVGVSKIIAPTGEIDSGVVVTPRCSVYNYGNRSENYSIRLKIGNFYNESASVSGHLPGTYQEIFFPNWEAREVGAHSVSCSTELARDMIRGNDKKTDSVEVLRLVKDVGVESIIRPYVYESQGPLRPKALVKNYGETQEEFWVYFTINIHLGNLVYSDSQLVSLLPDSTLEVEFSEWYATGPILYQAKCSTALFGDNNPENDAKGRIFLVEAQVYDVGVLEISRPRGEISPGPIRPKAKVYNYGHYPESFFTYFKIYSGKELVYYDSSYVSDIYPNEARDVLFDEWNAQVGEYTGQCSTALATDQNHLNDKQIVSFRVRVPTQGWVLVGQVPLNPDGKRIKSGGGMTECAGKLYILKGNNTRSLYSYLPGSASAIYEDSLPLGNSNKKVKKGSGITSDGERFLYIFKGSGTKEFFRYDCQRETIWQELPPVLGEKGLKGGTGVCHLSDFIYLLKGSNTTEFYRFNLANRNWEQLSSPPRSKGFKDGSCLLAHQGKIYLLGNNYNNFYRYSPSANSWDTLKPMPLYHPQVNKKKKVKEGAALTAKGDKIFAFKGGNTGEFWMYDLTQDSWVGLETIPRADERKRVKGGGALVASGEEIWALKGNNTSSIWKYIGGKEEWYSREGSSEAISLNQKEIIRIFPNPTKGSIKVYYHLPRGEKVILEVYNTFGALLYKEETERGEFRVEKLPAGVYLLRLRDKDNKRREERKLIVVK